MNEVQFFQVEVQDEFQWDGLTYIKINTAQGMLSDGTKINFNLNDWVVSL